MQCFRYLISKIYLRKKSITNFKLVLQNFHKKKSDMYLCRETLTKYVFQSVPHASFNPSIVLALIQICIRTHSLLHFHQSFLLEEKLGHFLQKQSFTDILHNSCSLKFRNIHSKILVLESLYNKAPGLKVCNFIKKDSNTGVFL